MVNYRNEIGFGLVELMIVLAIGAILLTIAMPSMTDFIQNNRAAALSNDFVVAIHLARSEAVKRGVPVSICPSADIVGTTCRNNNDWGNGWIVFVDENADGTFQNVGDRLFIKQALEEGANINAGNNRITFANTGFVRTGAGNYTLSAHGCVGNHGRIVSLAPTGHLALSDTVCS